MPARVRLKLDPADKILLKRNLNKNGKGQRFFTHEIKRLSDPYVPMLTGRLKTDVTELPGSISFNAPYARTQWYANKGNGLRGARWTERMRIDRGKEIGQATAEYCGGKSK